MGGQGGSWTPTKRRGPIAAEFQGPGPAAINLPSLFGNGNIKESNKIRAPSFTFGSRHSQKIISNGPAPNSYNTSGINTRGKDTLKAPTLHIRPNDPKPFLTPAPGAYNPDTADKDVKPSAPKYSFGIKGKSEKPSDGPAPNAYSIPVPNDGVSYSLSSRPKEIQKYNTPAPGTYETPNANNYKTKYPAYSLGTRTEIPSDHTQKPGPGAYTPEKSVEAMNRKASISFGVRHSPYLATLKGDYYVGAKTETENVSDSSKNLSSVKSSSFTNQSVSSSSSSQFVESRSSETIRTTTQMMTEVHSEGFRTRTSTFSKEPSFTLHQQPQLSIS